MLPSQVWEAFGMSLLVTLEWLLQEGRPLRGRGLKD